MFQLRSSTPIWQCTLPELVNEIINSPLPIDAITRDYQFYENVTRFTVPSCKVLVILFTSSQDDLLNIQSPQIDNVRKIARFTKIHTMHIQSEDQLGGLYSTLLDVALPENEFEKIILHDFLSLFQVAEPSLAPTIPLKCFNFKFLISILSLILQCPAKMSLIESYLPHVREVPFYIPKLVYSDEQKLMADLQMIRNDPKSEPALNFINVNVILLNLGFVMLQNANSESNSLIFYCPCCSIYSFILRLSAISLTCKF